MNTNLTKGTKGFTIIEVVLVLAIAGLIFLMVFIALPTLQSNQRDTQRRDDVSRMKAQINQYQANNKGDVPTSPGATQCGVVAKTIGSFIDNYLTTGGKQYKDPDGTDYKTRCKTTDVASTDAAGTWYYVVANTCSGEALKSPAVGSARDYAIRMKLEGSGIMCVDSKN